MPVYDRRRAGRVELRWRIQLRPAEGGDVIRGQTQNVSTTGFYCTAEQPLSPGDHLECELSVAEDTVMRRRVKVLRVEISGREAGFGVACEFE